MMKSDTRIGLTVFVGLMTSVAIASATFSQTALEGTYWKAVELAGTPVPALSGNREPHLVFQPAGRWSGSDGCNRMTGGYTLKGEGVTFGEAAGTLMACADTADLERRFRAALKGTSHWRIAGARLELFGATGKPLAVFERREPPAGSSTAPSLPGTRWQLVRFQGGDGATLTPDDRAKYTIDFGDGGKLSVRLDCNRGSGTWKATGPSGLALGPLATTRAKCPDGSLHDQILKQWSAIRSFVIKDGHLFLSLMADGGIYEFEPPIGKD